MDFPQEIALPQRTIFRKGAALELAREAAQFGTRGLVVHGSSLEKGGAKGEIFRRFPAGSRVGSFCRGKGEPTLDEISRVIAEAKALEADWIAGIGGGSTLDLAKASAGLYRAREKPEYYQAGGALEAAGIPFIAVPTTAGTGSEATPNAVIINTAKRAKLSIRDASFMAQTVILDAGLLEGLPLPVMCYAAMDALVQAYESSISKYATWFTESFALKSVELIDRNILPASRTRKDEHMSALLLGSYCAGIAFASSRLGVIHGIAHPLGALYGFPHGLICAALLIPSIELNREAMGGKYDVLSNILGKDLSERIEELLGEFDIVSPFRGKELIEKEKIIAETLASGSTAANPKKIERGDVERILRDIF